MDRPMHVKYIKRKCLVRGCNNIGSFNLSRNREFGGSIIICRDCLQAALNEANALERPATAIKKEPETPAKKKGSKTNGNDKQAKEE